MLTSSAIGSSHEKKRRGARAARALATENVTNTPPRVSNCKIPPNNKEEIWPGNNIKPSRGKVTFTLEGGWQQDNPSRGWYASVPSTKSICPRKGGDIGFENDIMEWEERYLFSHLLLHKYERNLTQPGVSIRVFNAIWGNPTRISNKSPVQLYYRRSLNNRSHKKASHEPNRIEPNRKK